MFHAPSKQFDKELYKILVTIRDGDNINKYLSLDPKHADALVRAIQGKYITGVIYQGRNANNKHCFQGESTITQSGLEFISTFSE